MKVAIASGKGGTGKTTVSASLVSVWEDPVVAMDLDVEEPNLHLFLKPRIAMRKTAFMQIPVADESRCTHCRKCSDLCQFKAISVLGDVLMIFPEMCHGCGGCLTVCPEGALTVGTRELGKIEIGMAARHDFLMGRLRVGEAMSPPLMRHVKTELEKLIAVDTRDVIIDAPPGVSCPAVNAVMDSDVIVLVTEPTPFGLFDLKLARKAFLPLGIPMGVVINRAGLGSEEVYDFCDGNNLEILAEIPYDRRIAETYANGDIPAETMPGLRSLFMDLQDAVKSMGTRVEFPKEAARE
jgi:MinD superfamily P-loop ATPase